MMAIETAGRVFHVCSMCETNRWSIPPMVRVSVTLTQAERPNVEVFVGAELERLAADLKLPRNRTSAP